MKRFLFLISFVASISLQAQVSKTVNVATPGTLSTLLTDSEKQNVTNLIVTGNIDKRDFNVMKKMGNLDVLDISETTVAEYSKYPANTIPEYVLYDDVAASSSQINSIKLPTSITSIGYGAFYQCYKLTSVTIPSSVITIEGNAFNGCRIESIIIPPFVTSIGNYAFSGCPINSIIIPSSVVFIGRGAFSGTALTSVNIPASVTRIGGLGDGAFERCVNLAAINVDNANPNYSSEDGVLFDKSKTEILTYPSAKKDINYTIPSSVTTIGYDILSNSELMSISIPASVTSFGYMSCPKINIHQCE